jgi:hypothetical protein
MIQAKETENPMGTGRFFSPDKHFPFFLILCEREGEAVL